MTESPVVFSTPIATRVAAAAALAWLLAGCGSNGAGGAGAPQALMSPAGAGSGEPHLAVTDDGRAVLSWLEPTADGYALRFSTLTDGGWSAPQVVASGTDFFVNWADFPSVQPITADVWAAHWLRMAEGSFASYDIVLSLSTDGGRTWSDGELLNRDGVLTEHGFASLFPWGGDIGAVWLDGRRLAEQFESGVVDPDVPVGTSLRFARIRYDGTVTERGELDELVCDCCATDAVVTDAGPAVVYRDRSPEEIRDIKLLRHIGSEWAAPVSVAADGWRIEGCPVNGPAIAARGEEIAAAWFTAAEERPRLRLARSTDGGATFAPAIDVDGNRAFGYADVVLLDDGAAYVSWWRRGGAGGLALAVRRVAPDGGLGEMRIVAESDVAQPLDVPQMVAAGDRLVFVWTDAAEMRVKTAAMRLPRS
ncbi:MAG TPA: sialidase family protein [Gammaproteobacteria bacterium]